MLGYIFELTSPDLEAKIFWDNIQWISALIWPLAFLAFALQYTGHQLSQLKRILGLLAGPMLIFWLLVFTDPLHGLIRPVAWLAPGEPFPALVYDFTLTVWLIALYGYGLFLSSLFILITRFIRPHRLYRAQVGVIILGAFIPAVGTGLTMLGLTLTFHRDITPFTFALSNLVIGWGLFRYGLFDLAPVARDRVIERMGDAVIVLDTQNRLVDLNPAAQALIGQTASPVIGQPAAQVLAQWPLLGEPYQDVVETQTEITLGEREGQRHFDLRIWPLRDFRGRLTGRLIVVRDITERVRVEEELRRHRERLEELVNERTADLTRANEQLKQVFEAETQRRREAEALKDIASALNSTLNLEEVLDHILSHVGRVVQHDMVNISLIESGMTHVVRAQGYDKHGSGERVLRSHHLVADTPTLHRMVETGQPLVISDTFAHPGWIVKDELWLRSYAGAPIRLEGEVIGFLNLDSDIPGFFTAAVAERLQVFADQAALAIKNARLYAETKQRAKHLAVLHELDQAITASLTADQVYRAFAQQTLRLLPYDFMSINLVEEDNLCLTYAAGEEPLAPVGSRIPLKALEISRWVIEQGQSFLSTDLVSEQRLAAYQPLITMGMRSAMVLPLRVKGQVIGIWFLSRRQVEGYGSDDLVIAQSVAEQLAIALENARLFEQVQRYAEELEQRVADRTRELSALYEVTAVASESFDLKTTLERSLERVQVAMRGQAGAIHLLDETREGLQLAVQQGQPLDLIAQIDSLPLGSHLASWVIEHEKPLIVPDRAADPRAVQESIPGLETYIGVPLRARGQALGVLSVVREKGQAQFNVEEVALLTSIADYVGVVVESARLRQQAEQTAVMEERARLARDLHDSVTQLLYSVNLFASVGQEAYRLGDLEQVNHCLAELGTTAQQALKEMRLLVYELRPPALEHDGLVKALQQRLEAVEGRAGVKTQLLADRMLELPGPVEEALYHIAQEALNNALKHAAATSVTVRLNREDHRLELEVADNGSGFDPQAVNGQGGLGLVSIRERVEKLGGVLTILSAPGAGTKVQVRVELV
jgi:PAS domain S-box-containing protein